MAGLVPAIHAPCLSKKEDVDARDRPGHDEESISLSDALTSAAIVVIPGRAHFGANPESITTIQGYGCRACASRSAVADLDNDNAELG